MENAGKNLEVALTTQMTNRDNRPDNAVKE
jgi:hypothetical protein